MVLSTQRTLYHGNVVVLYSKASGKTVRIKDDHTLEGRGEEGVLGINPHNHVLIM